MTVAVILLWCIFQLPAASYHHGKPALYAPRSGSFRIAIFSDLHYGEDEHSFGIEQDRKSTEMMRHVLSAERPDLVILNGDLITGENTFAFNSTNYVHQIVKPLVEGGYRWASTYGNHDSKFNLSRDALFQAESKYKYSLTQRGGTDTDGITNYVLPVFPPSTASPVFSPISWLKARFWVSQPIALLWFLDSRGVAKYQHSPANVDDISNHVSERTAKWLRARSSALKKSYGVLPSFVFVHIPVRAFSDLQTSPTPPIVHGHEYPGLNDDVPLARQGYSYAGNESVPLMMALLAMEGLHSVFSGHDHGDSWCGRWPSISSEVAERNLFLCFCKHSGFGGYGTWNRGVRQLKLSFEKNGAMAVETWVRMEDGETITAVTLNETYGTDLYPVEDGGYHTSETDSS